MSVRLRPRVGYLLGGAVAVAVLCGASLAYACIPQPILTVTSKGASEPGRMVTLNGLRFGSGTVEVRWDATDGPLMTSNPGPNFSAEVAVPAAVPGFHTFVAFARQDDGSVGNLAASAAVEIGGSGTAVPAKSASVASGDTSKDSSTPLLPIAVVGIVFLALGTLLGAWWSRRRLPADGGAEPLAVAPPA